MKTLTLIEQIVAKLHNLPEPNIQEVLEFVEILVWYRYQSEKLQTAEVLQPAQPASLIERMGIPHEVTTTDMARAERCGEGATASQYSKPDVNRDPNH